MDYSLGLMRGKAEKIGRPGVWRLRYRAGGHSDYCVFPDNSAFVLNSGLQVGESQSIQYSLRNYCVLRVQLSGRMEELVGGELHERAGSSSSLVYPGRFIKYGFHLPGPQPIFSTTISFPPRLLADFLSNAELEQLELFSRGKPSPAPQFIRLPSSALLMELSKELFRLELERSAQRLVGKGIMLQMIGEALGRMLQQATHRAELTRLRQHDIERLNNIRERIDDSFEAQHSIEELARWGGLNRRKLTEGFKLLFGSTVAEYLLRTRMSHAREMLISGKSVAAVAASVGYQDRTSFSRAFRRLYGYSPADVPAGD